MFSGSGWPSRQSRSTRFAERPSGNCLFIRSWNWAEVFSMNPHPGYVLSLRNIEVVWTVFSRAVQPTIKPYDGQENKESVSSGLSGQCRRGRVDLSTHVADGSIKLEGIGGSMTETSRQGILQPSTCSPCGNQRDSDYLCPS